MRFSCFGGRKEEKNNKKNMGSTTSTPKVHAPDSSSSGRREGPTGSGSLSRMADGRGPAADDYRKILEPVKGPGRMQYHPDIPKSLTPKGYAKVKLMMNLANKQYTTLVNRLQKHGQLWEDPDFPANDQSIGDVSGVTGNVEWRRPKEINPNAEFIVEGATRFDIEQGQLGDCWLLAVLSSLASHQAMFDQVVPKGQDMQGSDYVGIFRFRFWRFGQWNEVLVDDRLPVSRGSGGLVFMHSASNSEFWSALVEKAYAKLNGNYGHLSGGSQSEAMEDVTGGICMPINLEPGKRPQDLEQKLYRYDKSCCLMGCAIESSEIEARMGQGLIGGHAYSVTGVRSVKYGGDRLTLVRCRNPWGGRHEWTGRWSDGSQEWNRISSQEKNQLMLEFNEDGEFWMAYEDFVSNFTKLEVCHLGLESLESEESIRGKFRMEETVFTSAWEKSVNAGGCINNRQTFWTNPQFRFTVTDPDPDDDDNKCSVIIGVMQKDVRRKTGTNFLTIGFMVYEAPPDQTALISKREFLTKRAVGQSVYTNNREVVSSYRLLPGGYVIVPTTYQPAQEAKFIVRVLSTVAVADHELDNNNETVGIDKDIEGALEEERLIANEDSEIEQHFRELMNPITESINARQLMEILNRSSLRVYEGFSGFSIEMCRTMVATIDSNLTGSVELGELMSLWRKIVAWKMVFYNNDVDRNGHFDAMEYRQALLQCGFNVSNNMLSTLIHRYADIQSGTLAYEDFIMSLLRLQSSFETVRAHPRRDDGTKLFKDEDYMRFTCYT